MLSGETETNYNHHKLRLKKKKIPRYDEDQHLSIFEIEGIFSVQHYGYYQSLNGYLHLFFYSWSSYNRSVFNPYTVLYDISFYSHSILILQVSVNTSSVVEHQILIETPDCTHMTQVELILLYQNLTKNQRDC